MAGHRMQLTNEEQILDIGFRGSVLEEIRGPENIRRKDRELRKHECYRDMTKKWVVESLVHEGLKPETIKQMETRASNISIAKKIVNKLSMTYVNGVIRKVDDDKGTEQIDDFAREMDFNSKMLKTDRYLELFQNTMVYVVPERVPRESTPEAPKFKIKAKPLVPYLYDVIEDADDREIPRVVILSQFVERNRIFSDVILNDNEDGRVSGVIPKFHGGNRKDEIIADKPEDEGTGGMRVFIWWSDKFHFTTDEKGTILPNSPPDLMNPIGILPFVNYSEDQDGSFWAVSGDDLIDGAILINKLLTDMYAIAYQQGYGQLVITGKDIPKTIESGPHTAMILEQASTDDPTPSVTYSSASPPLGDWMQMAEQQTALVLTSKNLSVRTVAAKLDASDPASGIARLVDLSESTGDNQERQRLLKDNEPEVWDRIKRWDDLLAGKKALSENFAALGQIPDANVKTEFLDPKPVVTEAEKLLNLKARKELGLNTKLQLLQMDNPDLSIDEAKAQLAEIKAEKEISAATFGLGPRGGPPGGINIQKGGEEETKAEETTAEASEEVA